MPGAELLGFTGKLPVDAHVDAQNIFGIYFKKSTSTLDNGRSAYVSADAKWMVWDGMKDGKHFWVVGKAVHVGKAWGCIAVDDEADSPQQITGGWRVWKKYEGYPEPCNGQLPRIKVLAAPDLQLLHNFPEISGEVTVTRVRTREERDAAGRKHAIDLNLLDSKRPRTVSHNAVAQVAKARSVCAEAVDKRVLEIIQPAVEQYVKNEIDATALDQRKVAARAAAEAEHAPLSKLDRCFAAYTEALAARVKAEDAVEKATASEDAAKAELATAVRALLPQNEAGPSASGRVKDEFGSPHEPA